MAGGDRRVFAIIVVKQMFGGIGCNFANPAIAARIVLLVSFPSSMTRFIEPVSDVVTSATPLGYINGTGAEAFTFKSLFFGMHAGSIGETSAFLLLVGGVYLMLRRIISPVIPGVLYRHGSSLFVNFGSGYCGFGIGRRLNSRRGVYGDRLYNKPRNRAR